MKPLFVCMSALFVVACGNDTPPQQAAIPPAPASVPAAPQPQPEAVKPAPRPDPDAELAARVKKALEEASSEISQGVDVAAANGVVRLYGTVQSGAARRQAEKITAATPGVSSVENKLVVVKGS
jgi:hypothetical protein